MTHVFASLLVAIALLSTSAAPALQPQTLKRFAQVEDGFYRGSFPELNEQLETLKSIGVKTIINLSSNEERSALEEQRARSLGLKIVSIPLNGWHSPSEAQTARVQALLNDQSLRPIYVHCKHGRERTGVMIGIYRVESEGWPAEQAYVEMKAQGFRTYSIPLRTYFKKRVGLLEQTH